MYNFHIGIRQIDITPPVGMEMAGFAGRGDSTGVRAPLTATVYIFGCSDKLKTPVHPHLVLLTLDLVVLFQAVTDRVRSRIASQLDLKSCNLNGMPEDAVMVLSIHNHYGPLTMDGFGEINPRVQSYLDELEEKLVCAALSASTDMHPAKICAAKGTSGIGINRRERTSDGHIVIGNNPNEPIDRELLCIKLSSNHNDHPLSLIIITACHPVSQERGVCEFSADFVSPMREQLERELNCPIGFIQGACGDINPVQMGNSYATAERLGHQLADEIRAILQQMKPVSTLPLGVRTTVLNLPAREVESVDAAKEKVHELESLIQQARDTRQPRTTIAWWEWNLKWANTRLSHIRNHTPLPPVKCLIQVFRMGDVAVASSQGELFNEIGTAVKHRSPFHTTIVAGYNGDTIGYVPTAKAFSEGGYEVETSLVGPQAAEMIQHEMIRLLHDLHAVERKS